MSYTRIRVNMTITIINIHKPVNILLYNEICRGKL